MYASFSPLAGRIGVAAKSRRVRRISWALAGAVMNRPVVDGHRRRLWWKGWKGSNGYSGRSG